MGVFAFLDFLGAGVRDGGGGARSCSFVIIL